MQYTVHYPSQIRRNEKEERGKEEIGARLSILGNISLSGVARARHSNYVFILRSIQKQTRSQSRQWKPGKDEHLKNSFKSEHEGFGLRDYNYFLGDISFFFSVRKVWRRTPLRHTYVEDISLNEIFAELPRSAAHELLIQKSQYPLANVPGLARDMCACRVRPRIRNIALSSWQCRTIPVLLGLRCVTEYFEVFFSMNFGGVSFTRRVSFSLHLLQKCSIRSDYICSELVETFAARTYYVRRKKE